MDGFRGGNVQDGSGAMLAEGRGAVALSSPRGDECFCGECSGDLAAPETLVDGSDTSFSCEAPACDTFLALMST